MLYFQLPVTREKYGRTLVQYPAMLPSHPSNNIIYCGYIYYLMGEKVKDLQNILRLVFLTCIHVATMEHKGVFTNVSALFNAYLAV